MSFNKKTVKDINLKGKRVLLRVDYNVPLKNGKITDDYRIKKSLPTIEYLLDQGCSLVLCSHLGRPDGTVNMEFSLRPVAAHLSHLLKRDVAFSTESVGSGAFAAASKLHPGQLLLLENLRFDPGEEANDKQFAQQLASLGEVFVQDAFGVVHRAHASTEAVTQFLPSVAGLLLAQEVSIITDTMEKPERPLMAIIGGAKISDKIEVINRFIDIADAVAIGGAMANTFLLAEGIPVGKSLDEPEEKHLAKQIIAKARAKAKAGRFIFYIPQDGVVATRMDKTAHTRIVDWEAHVIASIENYPKRPPRQSMHIQANEAIFDIGPFSGAFIAGVMQGMSTVIWNGAMGVTEVPSLDGPIGPFAHGTELIVEAMLGQFGHKPITVLGGGDTVGYIEARKMTDYFNHVSTGGGASMDLMSGKKLPGVEALQGTGK